VKVNTKTRSHINALEYSFIGLEIKQTILPNGIQIAQ